MGGGPEMVTSRVLRREVVILWVATAACVAAFPMEHSHAEPATLEGAEVAMLSEADGADPA